MITEVLVFVKIIRVLIMLFLNVCIVDIRTVQNSGNEYNIVASYIK